MGTTATREPAGPAPWWFGWCLARMVGVLLVYLAGARVNGDPTYYLASLASVLDQGWSRVLPEYPLPIAVALWPLHLVVAAGASPSVVVLLALLVLDLGFCATLARRLGRASVRCWVWGVLLLGPVALQRLDLVPGVLLALSVLAAGPRSVGVLLALGAAAKVFPVAALPAALAVPSGPGPWSPRRR